MSSQKIRSGNIEFISDGFHDILCSEGVRNLVDEYAQGVKARADAAAPESEGGYRVHTYIGEYGKGRYISSISTTDFASRKAEAEHNALSGALL